MNAPKIANKDARQYVGTLSPFRGSNLYGEAVKPGVYVCYSYGSHFPLLAHIKGEWYRNCDKYSKTTSKHKGQATPHGISFKEVSTKELTDKIYNS